MKRTANRAASIEAGAIAGLAGLAVFLALHHVWIAPIWFIAPVGAAFAASGGAAVGAAYAELRPRIPRRPWTSVWVMAAISAVLAPAIVVAELVGPIYAFGSDGKGVLLVRASEAVIAFVGGLLTTATLTGGLLGAVIGRTRRAIMVTAVAGFGLALGPGHNIPLLGGTSAVTTELAILAAVVGVASIVLVEVEMRRDVQVAPSESEYPKTSSRGTRKTRAIWNAISSDGE